MNKHQLIFIKFGGSLITDKTMPMTPRVNMIKQLAIEVKQSLHSNPNLQLIIGHGSGSFGHAVAHEYQTHKGGQGRIYWDGFARVWAAARELNHIVINALTQVDLPVIAFPPSAAVISQDKSIKSWDTRPIQQALLRRLIPVVYGDVVFDSHLGGTILSTEDLFLHLTERFSPDRILLVGLDQGVYADTEHPSEIIPLITPQNFEKVLPALPASQAVDVTGGMLSKVVSMVSLIKTNPLLKILIFSGEQPGNLFSAIGNQNKLPGTLIAHQ